MPQFDLIIYFAAAKDVLIAFFIVFFLIETFFIEKLGLITKIRQKLKKHLTGEKFQEKYQEVENMQKMHKLYNDATPFIQFSTATTALLLLVVEAFEDDTK